MIVKLWVVNANLMKWHLFSNDKKVSEERLEVKNIQKILSCQKYHATMYNQSTSVWLCETTELISGNFFKKAYTDIGSVLFI